MALGRIQQVLCTAKKDKTKIADERRAMPYADQKIPF